MKDALNFVRSFLLNISLLHAPPQVYVLCQCLVQYCKRDQQLCVLGCGLHNSRDSGRHLYVKKYCCPQQSTQIPDFEPRKMLVSFMSANTSQATTVVQLELAYLIFFIFFNKDECCVFRISGAGDWMTVVLTCSFFIFSACICSVPPARKVWVDPSVTFQ